MAEHTRAAQQALAPHTCGGSVYLVPDVPLLQTELLVLLRRRGLTTLGDLQDPTRYAQVYECARCGARWPLEEESPEA